MVTDSNIESNDMVNKMCRTCLEYKPFNEMKNIFLTCNEVLPEFLNEFISSESIKDVLISFIQIEVSNNYILVQTLQLK